MDKICLSDLKVNEKCKVVSLNIKDVELKRRLLDMGITKGTEILIRRIAPLGDPIDIELRGYELAIRKKDMANIEVEVV